jgi:methylenetetrahydrofolate reductase (NADPH)
MILLEIVAKNNETFSGEVKEILSLFPEIDIINIPEIISLPIRCFDSSKVLLKAGIPTIPHIRAMDYAINDHLKRVSELIPLGLKSLLVINGDITPTNTLNNPPSTIEVVKALKKEYPFLSIYCGLDPYRSSYKEEITYCQKKLAAGADGFFTQPFFEEKLALPYLNELKDTTLFLGSSPVLSKSNYEYWVTKNKVTFPPDFKIDFEYSSQIAKKLLALAKNYHQHVYLMPITTPVIKYLTGVFK